MAFAVCGVEIIACRRIDSAADPRMQSLRRRPIAPRFATLQFFVPHRSARAIGFIPGRTFFWYRASVNV
jgi:hypothetical protein